MVERLRTRLDLRSVAGLAVVMAVEIFAGYPQLALLAAVAAGAWALYRARGSNRPTAFLLRVAGGVLFGIGLAGVQLLPFMEYLHDSWVLHYRSLWMARFAAPLESAILLLMPYYYGSPTGWDFWGYLNFNETAASVGLLPWAVLPATLLVGWRRAGTRFFLGLAVLAAGLLYEIPVLNPALTRSPVLSWVVSTRAAAFFVFALSALCAIGLDLLPKVEPSRLRAAERGVKVGFVVLVGIGFFFVARDYPSIARVTMKVPVVAQYVAFLLALTVATVLALRLLRTNGAPPRSVLIALVLIQVIGMLPLALTYNPVIDAHLLFPAPPPAVRHLQVRSREDPGRVFLGVTMNMGLMYGLSEVTGHDGMAPRRIVEVTNPAPGFDFVGSGVNSLTIPLDSPIFDLLGIRRVIVPPRAGPPPPHFTLEYDGPDGRVYRNERAQPRVFLAPQALPCVDDATALRLIRNGAIDFTETVMLETCEPVPASGAGPSVSTTEIRVSMPDRVVIHVMSDSPGYLVLTDTWFPGWHARVDQQASPLWRANLAFRAVWVPAGAHEVEFRYLPVSVRYGFMLSVVVACLLAGLCLVKESRRV